MHIAGIINRYLYRKTGSPISEGASTETMQTTEAGRARGFQSHIGGLTEWLLTQ